VIEKTDGWYLQINVPENWKDEKLRDKVSTKDLGRASIPDQSFNKENGTVIDHIPAETSISFFPIINTWI
jgi:alpha-N-arabinofuranosidase